MNDTSGKQSLPPAHQAFLTTYPFPELIERGWTLAELSAPRQRPGTSDSVRIATMQDQHGRLLTVEIDDHDRLRGSAAFGHTDNGPPLIATSARALEVLGGTAPDASYAVLAALDDVRTINNRKRTNG